MIVRAAVVSSRVAPRHRVVGMLADRCVLATTKSLSDLLASGLAEASDVVIADVDAGEVEQVAAIAALPHRPELVLLTGRTDPGAEARLISAGASVVLWRGLEDEELQTALGALIDKVGRGDATAEAGSAAPPVSASPSMQELLAVSERVAPAGSSVLVLGETGSGKEWLARRIHDRSPRAGGPFVAVNCAAIPEGLAESELFGHVKGAFTGALRSRRGHFEVAHQGTLFLDEVGDLPPALQVRLLRVLQDRSFQPVGSERSVRVDVRIIAATNRDLDEDVERGAFRKDLYYRLAVVTLRVPPLRERREDIPGLVAVYARRFAQQLRRPVPRFTPDVMDALVAYSWPGNIRELINMVERTVLLGTDPAAIVAELQRTGAGAAGAETLVAAPSSLEEPVRNGRHATYAEARERALAAFEVDYFTELLRSTGGRIGAAAAAADMSPRTLYDRMRRHGLRKESFRG